MPVAERFINAAHRREILHALPQGRHRVGGLPPAECIAPLVVGHRLGGEWGVMQHGLFERDASLGDLLDLGANAAHGGNKPIQFGLILRLGGLHHERPCYRERKGGGVETIIHQAFCHICGGHAGVVLQAAQVEDAFVAHQVVLAGVEHWEGVGQFLRQVVGV